MSSFMDERGSMLLMMVWVILAFGLLFVFTSIGYPMIGQALYFIVAIGGLVLSEPIIKEIFNSYLFLLMIQRPNNFRLPIFIKEIQERSINKDIKVAKLTLARPINLKEYGKVDHIILEYEGELSDRLFFRPGYAQWGGIIFRHPQTEIVEVFQTPFTRTMIDHGYSIPVFHLAMASQDVNFERNTPKMIDVVDSKVDSKKMEALQLENQVLKQQLAEYKQMAINYEETINQLKAEIKALLATMGDIKHLAMEFLLTLIQASGNIKAAYSKLTKGSVMTFNKYLALTIIALAVIAFLAIYPQYINILLINLSNPVFAIIAIAIIIATLYILNRRK